MTWTPERIEKAAILWAGGHSCAAISKRIGGGASRLAVAGLAFRNRDRFPARPFGRLMNNKTDVGALVSAQARFRPRTDVPPKPLQPLAAALPGSAPRPWHTRTFGQCAAPVGGEGADTLSCCEPCDGSYCPAHRKLYYAKPATDAQRAAAKRMREAKLKSARTGQKARAA